MRSCFIYPFFCLLVFVSSSLAGENNAYADNNAKAEWGADEVEEVREELGSSWSDLDLGPLFTSGTDLAGNKRWRALGPFLERGTAADGRDFLAVRPFYSRSDSPPEGVVDQHVVWPVWARHVMDEDEQWNLGGVMYWHDWDTADPDSRYSFRILPVYFQGRDSKGESYFAVFPIYGSIHEFLFQDELSFVCFPLWVYLRVNEVETRAYPWPVISRTKGGRADRFNIFPFYGRASRGTDYEKRFIMWPFWTEARFGFEQDAGFAYILFPLFGHARLDTQETIFVIPPFFRFTKGREMSLIHCPWPLFQRAVGEEDKLYIWPLWGRKNRFNRDTWFFLWPLFLGERHLEEGGDVESRRFLFIPVFFRETRRRISEDGDDEHVNLSSQIKVWPLASYLKLEDRMLFRAPSLWPFRDYAAIERNYAPFWTLYTRSRLGSEVEDEVLWGFFRYRRSEEGAMDLSLFPLFNVSRDDDDDVREWSFLKGLIGYERAGADRALRLFYLFRIGI